jgi:hypothetical protein
MAFAKPPSAAPDLVQPKLRRFTTDAGIDIQFKKDVAGLTNFDLKTTAKLSLNIEPL